MSIERIEFGVFSMTKGTYPYTCTDGRYCFYDEHVKETERKTQSLLDEITSLKTELATLMSSLETWDEEFK